MVKFLFIQQFVEYDNGYAFVRKWLFRAAGTVTANSLVWFSGNFMFIPPSSALHTTRSHPSNHCTMPRGRTSWQLLWLFTVVSLMLSAQRIGAQKESTGSSVDVAQMSVVEIEDALQVCIHPSMFCFVCFLHDHGCGKSHVVRASMHQADCRQQCPLVQDLNRHKLASNPPSSSLASEVFSVLFPGTPAVNALLATLYISGPPSLSFTFSAIRYQH